MAFRANKNLTERTGAGMRRQSFVAESFANIEQQAAQRRPPPKYSDFNHGSIIYMNSTKNNTIKFVTSGRTET